MTWAVLVGLFVIAALATVVLVLLHRARSTLSSSRAADPRAGRESPGLLAPLAAATSDAVHSEAESLLHNAEPSAPTTQQHGASPSAVSVGSSHETGASVSQTVAADAVHEALATLRVREDEMHILRQDLHDQHVDLERREHRLAHREERCEEATRVLDDRALDLGRLEAALAAERRDMLERLANLTATEARAELISEVERDAKREAAVLARDIERTASREAEARAKGIIATAIQRLASEQTAETVVSMVRLPGDDMKGRIIGREGRNIRSFEQTTGVNLIVDETPEAVVLSCFDPVRREVGRLTLEELVADGRIHPSRIEEVYQRSVTEIDRLCRRAGEDAVVEVGVSDVHPHLVFVLGQLRYRTSYGQSVLKHLIESAHAAGLLAAELGVDGTLVKRAALLHDIGKALTHEAEGSHALVGADLAHRYGESPEIVHAIEAHHNEVEPRTLEAVLTQAADAISGGRPGARRESPEAYVKRLERLEEIAMSCEGVEKVFAMQAGREVRVMVLPEIVDDIGAQVLARDIVKQIEEELTYPGQIKVTVIRESRTTEIAR
jgi:ribonuclease Y